jgi:glycosyltransferase involved in cell wall biosynthesis
MKTLAIDLTYQPVGGALVQIKEIIKNIDVFNFERVLFFVTSENMHLFEDVENIKIQLKQVSFSNKSIVVRSVWAQMILPMLLVLKSIDLLFCPGNISPIINSKKKVQWIGTVGPFEGGFIKPFGLRKKIIIFLSKYLITLSAYTSDLVIYESKYTRNLFIKRYRQLIDKSIIFHIGKDDYFYPIKSSQFIKKNNYKNIEYILTVSHLYPYKKIEILINSFYKLELNKKELYLLIAGSTPDRNYFYKLKSLVKQYGLSKYIVFLGRVEKQDLRELYSQCKIFVFTSPFENFAYTLVEAMSCSAPIIATNTTAMPETCGEAALYYEPDNEQELSNCLMKYLSDEKERLKFKELSLQKVTEYENYTDINRKTNESLERLVQGD